MVTQAPSVREVLQSCLDNSKQGSAVPLIPKLPPAKENGKMLFTFDDALMATKNYHFHQKILETTPSEAAITGLFQASTDLAYLYDNIDSAEPAARKVLEYWIEIWNFEATLVNNNTPNPSVAQGQTD